MLDTTPSKSSKQKTKTTIQKNSAEIRSIPVIILAVLGALLTTVGTLTVFASVILSIAMTFIGVRIVDEVIFPVYARDYVTFTCAAIVVLALGIFFVLGGLGMMRRSWKVPGWVTVLLMVVFVGGIAVGGLAAPASVTRAWQAYEDAHHTSTKEVAPFKNVELKGRDTKFIFQKGDTYSLEISHLGTFDEKKLFTTVDSDTLKIDSDEFDGKLCNALCYGYNDRDLVITIHAPKLDNIILNGKKVHLPSAALFNNSKVIIE